KPCGPIQDRESLAEVGPLPAVTSTPLCAALNRTPAWPFVGTLVVTAAVRLDPWAPLTMSCTSASLGVPVVAPAVWPNRRPSMLAGTEMLSLTAGVATAEIVAAMPCAQRASWYTPAA